VLRRILVVLVVVAAAFAILTYAVLPRPTLAAVPPTFQLSWPVARGAYHVHSRYSDGTGTFDEIAAAAAAAGLQFVIVTDHGNGTRDPEPPSYRSGVLMIDAVEISTDAGHVVALDLPRAPYPIAGDPRDVLDDIHRLGGFAIAAHPGSLKPALRWGDWEAAFDGLEWLNADSEWRDEFWGSLGKVLLTYSFRPTETLAGLLDRPSEVLQQWDRLVARRRVSALAGADAHARLGFRQREPYEDRVLWRAPSYQASFEAFVNHVVLDGPLIGDAAVDAATVLSAIREGRIFTSVDGIARLSRFEAKATVGPAVARPGEYLDVPGPVAIDARIAAPEGTTLVLLKDGAPIYDGASNEIRVDVGNAPGAYRIEARLPASITRSSVPWLLTNPMYVGLRAAHERATVTPAAPAATARSGLATGQWRAEAGPGSTSTLTPRALADGTPALEWRFSLAGGPRAEQYAALHFPVDQHLAGHDRIQFRVESDRPHRLWVQIRAPDDRGGQRWGRTFYVDPTLRSIEFRFSELKPMQPDQTERQPLDRMDSVLFVIDTLNTSPGTSGVLRFPDLWLAK
jgi:PHP domain-containing protein